MKRIVHTSNWGCRRSGLYECVKDQIKYERKHGFDSQMTFFAHDKPKDFIAVDDGWLSPITWEESKNADLYIIHHGLPAELDEKKNPKKKVLVVHGTVEYLLLEEVFSHAEKTGFNQHINMLRDCDVAVAVNPHDYDIYKIYDDKNRLCLVHDAIDTERFTIDGYQHPFVNHPQILFCDSLRINKLGWHKEFP